MCIIYYAETLNHAVHSRADTVEKVSKAHPLILKDGTVGTIRIKMLTTAICSWNTIHIPQTQ